MTDRNKSKRKTEFGADKEADKIFEYLPRRLKNIAKPNAFIFIDSAGRLCIAIDGGGFLSINEQDLVKVHGDELYEG